MRVRQGSSIAVAVLLTARSARAQTNDPAAAQALFDEGKRLVAQGRGSEACPKFLASLKLDPAPGAAFKLAECYENSGQTASAWARYLEAASLAQQAGQAERMQVARAQAAALEPRLSRLVIAVPSHDEAASDPKPRAPAEPSAPDGLSVTRDGVAIDAAVWGTAVPADPGKHVVEARAPGKKPWSITVDVAAGDATARVEIPVLPDAAEPAPVAAKPVEPAAPARETAAEGWPAPKTAGVVLMGAGGVGVVLGSVLGVVAHDTYVDLLAKCPNATCTRSEQSEVNLYHTTSGAFVGSFAGAAALLGTGIVVFLKVPAATSRTGRFVVPRLGVGYVGVDGGF